MTHVVGTGGAGPLGSHLCEQLSADGCEVPALDSFRTGTPNRVVHLTGRDGFRMITCAVSAYVDAPGSADHVLLDASPSGPAAPAVCER